MGFENTKLHLPDGYKKQSMILQYHLAQVNIGKIVSEGHIPTPLKAIERLDHINQIRGNRFCIWI
jgi:hypothetical protein